MIKKVNISTTLFNQWITTDYTNFGDPFRIKKGIDKDDVLIDVKLSTDCKTITLWYDKELPQEVTVEAVRMKEYKAGDLLK